MPTRINPKMMNWSLWMNSEIPGHPFGDDWFSQCGIL